MLFILDGFGWYSVHSDVVGSILKICFFNGDNGLYYIYFSFHSASLDQDIPDHANLSSFVPDFTLDVRPSMRMNRNSPKVVSANVDRLRRQVENYRAFNHLNVSE